MLVIFDPFRHRGRDLQLVSVTMFFIAWYSQIQSAYRNILYATVNPIIQFQKCVNHPNWLPRCCTTTYISLQNSKAFKFPVAEKNSWPASDQSSFRTSCVMRGIINRIRRACAPWRLETWNWGRRRRMVETCLNMKGDTPRIYVYIYIFVYITWRSYWKVFYQ